MIDVKDEILDGDPKYRIRNKNGDILFDNLTIEQISPVLQQPTPLNKALFDNIYGNISLTREYTKIRAILDMKIYDGTEDDMFRSDLKTFTQGSSSWYNTYGNYILTSVSTSASGSGYDTTKVIDNKDNTYFTMATYATAGVIFKYPQAVKCKKVRIKTDLQTPSLFLQGSNDGENYENIKDFSGVVLNGEYVLENENYYKYYKLVGTGKSQPNTTHLYDMNFTEIYGELEQNNVLVLNNKIQNYTENMRILVDVSNIILDYPIYIDVNNLGKKLIVGINKNEGKYELVFDGNMFSAREAV